MPATPPGPPGPSFSLPDETTSLPPLGFEFDPCCRDQAAPAPPPAPAQLFARLLREQESPGTLLLARRVLAGFLAAAAPAGPGPESGPEQGAYPGTNTDTDMALDPRSCTAQTLSAYVAAARAEAGGKLAAVRAGGAEELGAAQRQRAVLGLLSGCWLDTLSQPATQPSVTVNRLFGHYFTLQGRGRPQAAAQHARARRLESAGVFLPEIEADDFLTAAGARDLTVWHACFYLALSRLPASFLPEVLGVHYAFHALGVDDLLADQPPALPEARLRAALAEYLDLTTRSETGEADRARMLAALRLTVRLERESVEMLAEQSAWLAEATLDEKVARIIARHAPYAGSQHGAVRVAGRTLSETLGDPDLDLAEFVSVFRSSRQLKANREGSTRFLDAIRFGGPMFGIFDEHEAAVFEAWAREAQSGQAPPVLVRAETLGDERAEAWRAAVAGAETPDVRYAPAPECDERELFYRLVNIENFPNMLPVALARTRGVLERATLLFEHGSGGRHTDATYFEYSETALLERVERIYWDKLVNPYRPLPAVPDADEVVFGQKIFALGSLVDGAWAHRIGNLGRYRTPADGMLFSIYADEMGRGDLRKNHITLIHQVLASMDVRLPHVREAAFREQDELPDTVYGLPLHQSCLALFPDTLFEEILGYNLGIEMFGLGAMRLHEAQKLRHHGFDPIYEEAHLSIDNVSAGHARQSAQIVARHLDRVARTAGPEAVRRQWRRIWSGYASFAYFIEAPLVKSLIQQGLGRPAAPPAPRTAPDHSSAQAAQAAESAESAAETALVI